MEITVFVSNYRENALSLGDYDSYRIQCSRRIKKIRRKLEPGTSKGKAYKGRAKATVADIAKNEDLVNLLVLLAERAWADGMHLRSARSVDSTKTITGSIRQHILSRFSKAAKQAQELALLLQDPASQASDREILEAWAYTYSLLGAVEFEKQSSGSRQGEGQVPAKQRWKKCLVAFSGARVIYDSLCRLLKQQDVFREMLNTTVDPSIRYAAYQSRVSRSLAVSIIARQNFPRDNGELVATLERFDSEALLEESTSKEVKSSDASPATITWRGRTVNIADASISQAISTVSAAENCLATLLSSNKRKYKSSLKAKSAAYDEVLSASFDAADAVRHAIEDLERERVDEGDLRMQGLRVTSLAVNYALVGWRIGRNRALVGEDDGMRFAGAKTRKPRRRGKGVEKNDEKERAKDTSNDKDGEDDDDLQLRTKSKFISNEERRGRKLARLRDRIALYDAILQSIDSVKELRGALRDESFVAELDGKRAYFQALKCLNIARTHALIHQYAESLALTTRARHLSKLARSKLASADDSDNFNESSQKTRGTNKRPTHTSQQNQNQNQNQQPSPPTLEIKPPLLSNLSTLLTSMSTYYQAMCTLAQQFAKETEQAAKINNNQALLITTTTSKSTSGETPSTSSSVPPRTATANNTAAAIPMEVALKRFNPAGTHPDRIMTYPPTNLLPIPLKPVVLDVAWNYIDYDDDVIDGSAAAAATTTKKGKEKDEGKQERKGEKEGEEKEKDAPTGRRGWFGFGRG